MIDEYDVKVSKKRAPKVIIIRTKEEEKEKLSM